MLKFCPLKIFNPSLITKRDWTFKKQEVLLTYEYLFHRRMPFQTVLFIVVSGASILRSFVTWSVLRCYCNVIPTKKIAVLIINFARPAPVPYHLLQCQTDVLNLCQDTAAQCVSFPAHRPGKGLFRGIGWKTKKAWGAGYERSKIWKFRKLTIFFLAHRIHRI